MSEEAGYARDAFLYLSHNPFTTSDRIATFKRSINRFLPFMDFVIVTFDRLAEAQRRVFMVEGIAIPHIIYNVSSLAKLPYPTKVPRGHFGPDTFLHEGCADLPILLFWRENKLYDNIWVCEDDVEYTGELGDLIISIRASNTDAGLACTHVRQLPPDWDHTYLFSSGNDDVSNLQKRVCFLPFFCITKAALAAIDDAYMRGWAGYNEMTWPIILDHAGIRIRDIGGNGPYVAPEDRSQRYIDNSPDGFSKLGSFGTLHIRLFPGREPNTLWHPVKTPRQWIWRNAKRLKSIYFWYKKKLISIIRA
jgi:hypothetical protein